MKYLYLICFLIVSACSSNNQYISKEEFCNKTEESNCDIHYSYYVSEETLFTPNSKLDSHILQHKPLNNK